MQFPVFPRIIKNVNVVSDVAIFLETQPGMAIHRNIQRSVMGVSDVNRAVSHFKGVRSHLHVMEQRGVASTCFSFDEHGVLVEGPQDD